MRLRVLGVVFVVLALVGWSCQVPTDSGQVSPGSAGSADVPISTTGLTALVEGEDWHIVGSAAEPAFQNSWEAASGALAWSVGFRIRESGVVDIQGAAKNTKPPVYGVDDVIFTLPAGYRPSTLTIIPTVGNTASDRSGNDVACLLFIETDGDVSVNRSTGGTGSLPPLVFLSAQVFLVGT